MSARQHTVPLSARIPVESSNLLNQLSDLTGRTRSSLIHEAIQHYLEHQLWKISGTKEAVEKAD